MHSLIATWYIKPGCEKEGRGALNELAQKVLETEPDTWAYVVHTAADGSLPPSSPGAVVFMEIYKDEAAFLAHVNGEAFTNFLRKHADLFVSVPPDNTSYFQVQNIDRLDGFIRQEATGLPPG